MRITTLKTYKAESKPIEPLWVSLYRGGVFTSRSWVPPIDVAAYMHGAGRAGPKAYLHVGAASLGTLTYAAIDHFDLYRPLGLFHVARKGPRQLSFATAEGHTHGAANDTERRGRGISGRRKVLRTRQLDPRTLSRSQDCRRESPTAQERSERACQGLRISARGSSARLIVHNTHPALGQRWQFSDIYQPSSLKLSEDLERAKGSSDRLAAGQKQSHIETHEVARPRKTD